MKRLKHLFILIIILFFCLPIFQIQAKAVFPDKKALQPPAQDVFPNISNNINFDSEQQLYLQSENYSTEIKNSEQKQIEPQKTPEQKRINNELFWFVFSIAIICIFLVIFFVAYKKYKAFFQKSN